MRRLQLKVQIAVGNFQLRVVTHVRIMRS